jgi:hypothetical protein
VAVDARTVDLGRVDLTEPWARGRLSAQMGGQGGGGHRVGLALALDRGGISPSAKVSAGKRGTACGAA